MARDLASKAKKAGVDRVAVTGVILAASERRANRDWFDGPRLFVPTVLTAGELEAQILDLKARYWAHKLKKGLLRLRRP